MEFKSTHQQGGTADKKLPPSLEKTDIACKDRTCSDTSPDDIENSLFLPKMLTSNQPLSKDEPGRYLKPRPHKEFDSAGTGRSFQERQGPLIRPRAVSWTEDSLNSCHEHAFLPQQELASIHKSSPLRMRPNSSTNPFIQDELHQRGYAYSSNDAVIVVRRTLSHEEPLSSPYTPRVRTVDALPSTPPPCIPRKESECDASSCMNVPFRMFLPDI